MIFALFIAKVFLSSGILFGYYWLFLRNRKFHQYNRFYLLLSLIISVIIPFISIPVSIIPDKPDSSIVYKAIEAMSISSPQSRTPVQIEEAPMLWVNAENIFMVLYGIGSVILLFVLLRSLSYIRSISKKYPCEYVDTLKFYKTKEPGTPFSFFNSVFWNEELNLKTPEGKQIFRHEFFHIKQHHSADILLSELIISFLWINPFFHLIKKELKTIHEFLADEFASSGTDKYSYAELLICQSINAKKMSIAHPFFHTNIKRRLAMITSFKNKDYSYASRLLVLPVAFLLFCAFTLYTKKLPESKAKPTTFLENDLVLQDTTKPKSTKTNEDPWEKTFTKVEVESAYPGGVAAWARFLQKTLVYPKKAIEKNIEGVVVVQFVVDKQGYLSDITVRQGPEELREEAMRVIRESNRWTPGVVRGKTVKSYRLQPINFRLKDANATAFNYYKDGEPGGYYKDDPVKYYEDDTSKYFKDNSGKLYKDGTSKYFKGDPGKFYKEEERAPVKDESGKMMSPNPNKEGFDADLSDDGPKRNTNNSFNYSSNKNKSVPVPAKGQLKSPNKIEYEWEGNKSTSPDSNIKNPKPTSFQYETNPKNKKPSKKYPVEPIEKTYNKVDA